MGIDSLDESYVFFRDPLVQEHLPWRMLFNHAERLLEVYPHSPKRTIALVRFLTLEG